MKTILTAALLSAVFVSFLFAQGGGSVGSTDAWTSSTAMTYTVLSKGIYSIGKNPANLMQDEDGHFELSTHFPLPNLNLRVGTDFLSLNEYNYFFGGMDSAGHTVSRFLNTDDKARLQKIFEGGGLILADVTLNHLSFSYKGGPKFGAIAFSVNDMIMSRVNFPAGVIDLLMNGNPPNKTYVLNDFDLKLSWIREYSFNYAREVGFLKPKAWKALYMGLGLKMVSGYAYTGVDEINTFITTTDTGTIKGQANLKVLTAFSPDFGVKYDFDSLGTPGKLKYSPFPKPAGSGFGFDIGFTGIVNDRFRFGVAITDIGSITWDKNTAEYAANSNIYFSSIVDTAQREEFLRQLRGEGKFVASFKRQLPTAFRLGVAYDVYKGEDNKYFVLSFDFNQGFNNEPRNSTTPRFSLGGEWKPGGWIPYLRGGFSAGGGDPFSWAIGGGFMIGPVEFNASTPDFLYIFSPGDGKRVAFSMGARWKF